MERGTVNGKSKPLIDLQKEVKPLLSLLHADLNFFFSLIEEMFLR